jgi:hypothetical protein
MAFGTPVREAGFGPLFKSGTFTLLAAGFAEAARFVGGEPLFSSGINLVH